MTDQEPRPGGEPDELSTLLGGLEGRLDAEIARLGADRVLRYREVIERARRTNVPAATMAMRMAEEDVSAVIMPSNRKGLPPSRPMADQRGPAGYRTIVADPPWPQKGGGSLKGREGFLDAGGRSKPLPYPVMSIEEICRMPVPAAADAHLYLWTTSGFLPSAFTVMKAWGFRYSTTLVWAKAPIGAGLGGAHGIATEFVLFGCRGRLPAVGKVGRNWWTWKRPYDERGKPRHSSKPEEFYAMVEQVSPGPYLEMFARRPRLGWDLWGDQAPDAVEIPT